MSPTLHLLDATTQTWRTFTRPVRVLEIHTLADILPALHEIDRAVTQSGLWAAGFLAYEAAPAFDPAMLTHPPVEGLPLLWFGLYELPIVNGQFPIPNSQLIIDHSQLAISSSPSAYHTALAQIKTHIAAGDTYQVNYTLRLRAPLPSSPLPLFSASPSPLFSPAPLPPYAAHLDLGRFVISSASPELF
ncbi:MAG: chorismate-binding protein, partial [Anaerolineales bacterium]|nr:chorismate-binding protein [Anaerolineales bacterium]